MPSGRPCSGSCRLRRGPGVGDENRPVHNWAAEHPPALVHRASAYHRIQTRGWLECLHSSLGVGARPSPTYLRQGPANWRGGRRAVRDMQSHVVPFVQGRSRRNFVLLDRQGVGHELPARRPPPVPPVVRVGPATPSRAGRSSGRCPSVPRPQSAVRRVVMMRTRLRRPALLRRSAQ